MSELELAYHRGREVLGLRKTEETKSCGNPDFVPSVVEEVEARRM